MKNTGDITMSLKNYKLIENYEETFENCRILLVTGQNETGKSSLIRGFIENLTAKSVTEDPVTRGKTEGSKKFTVPDRNGNPITIVHDFSTTNSKGSFYAIDHMGKKIKEVKKIREIIGVFEELSIDTFYTLQQTAEGRRKIIKNYFYPLLTEEEQQKVEFIDKETSKSGETFDQRTNLNAEVNALESLIKDSLLTEEEKVLVEEYENIDSEHKKLSVRYADLNNKHSSQDHIRIRIEEKRKELEGIQTEIPRIHQLAKEEIQTNNYEIIELERKIQQLRDKNNKIKEREKDKISELGEKETLISMEIKDLKETLPKESIEDLEAVKKELNEAEEILKQANRAIEKNRNYKNNYQNIVKKREEVDKLTEKIEKLRQEKVRIFENSKLPSGLKIEGDDFTWNNFAFNDAQISKSSALLVISEILCKIVEAKVVYIGEKALFDKDRFKKLVEIAEKHGKIPVLEQVIDNQTEIKVITEIYE